MWQIDAPPYAWLEERVPVFALDAAIDDATGVVVGAAFCKNECRKGKNGRINPESSRGHPKNLGRIGIGIRDGEN